MEEKELFSRRLDLDQLSLATGLIRSELRKLIVGQEKIIDLLLTAILADGHVLLEGVPGVAKTLAAKLTARTFQAEFSRIQFTPDLMPSDVLGSSIFNSGSSRFEFNRGPIFANIILIDEINRAPAKTQSALFEVMEERQVTVDGTTYAMSQPFMVIATQNPIEQEGTYQLPEAQLDRFLFKINIGYPTLAEEQTILSEFHARRGLNDLTVVQPVLDRQKVSDFRAVVNAIHIEANLIEYIALLVEQTRHHPSLYLGASPRASLALLSGAKAYAALHGRDFVSPEDIQAMLFPVLSHRLLLTPEREMEGITPDAVIRQIMESVDVPR